MCKVWKGFSEVRDTKIKAEFAREDHDGDVNKIGKWTGMVHGINKSGHVKPKHTIELEDVLYVPELRSNLFSITKEIKTKGARISNDDDVLILHYPDGKTISFDHIISTSKGFISATRIVAINNEPTKININKFHQICGHQYEKYTKETAKRLGIKLTEKWMTAYIVQEEK